MLNRLTLTDRYYPLNRGAIVDPEPTVGQIWGNVDLAEGKGGILRLYIPNGGVLCGQRSFQW